MRSMTGFGKGVAENGGKKVTVEIKTVNHKQFDLSVKSPRTLIFCEDAIRDVCKKYIGRGHIDVFCNYRDSAQGAVSIDTELAKKYLDAAKSLEKFGFVNDLTAAQVLKLPDIITVDTGEEDENAVSELVAEATDKACGNLLKMRVAEGENIKKDLSARLRNIETIVGGMKERAPEVSKNYAEKLKQRITDALNGVAFDEARFLNEVAIFVDKSDISEELARLDSHIFEGFKIIESDGDVGRKLDFLVQEINRELNTAGSKSNDLALTQKVLAAKNELEKFREQVQNIE